MKIPLISNLCQWSIETRNRQRLQHQREANHNKLRSSEAQTKQSFNSSDQFANGPGKVPVYVTVEEYRKYYMSSLEKLNKGNYTLDIR